MAAKTPKGAASHLREVMKQGFEQLEQEAPERLRRTRKLLELKEKSLDRRAKEDEEKKR